MDDKELLREYTEKGSESAFTRLVELHLDLVYSAALRRAGGNHHRAQEVTQMVFTDLARKASRLVEHPLLVGWLHRSTRWAAATLQRSEQRRAIKEGAAALVQSAELVEEPTADWAQLAPLLDDALDALDDKDRDALLLRYFNDLPYSEIGGKLGLNENAARMRVDRALGKLRGLLSKRGATSTASALALVLTGNAVVASPAGLAPTISATALGAATTGSGAALTFLFMTKLQLAVGAVAVALAIGLSFQWSKNERLQAQLTQLQNEASTTRTTTAKLARQAMEKEKMLQETNAALAALPPPLTPEQQERVQLDTIIRKGELDFEYAPLFRRLKLDHQTLDQFKALIVERNQAVYDAIKSAKNQGAEPASPSEESMIGESGTAEIDERIAVLLGSSRNEQFRDYMALQPFQYWGRRLALSEQGLSRFDSEKMLTPEFDERGTQLARLLVNSAHSYIDEVYRANGWPVEYPAELKNELAKVLSPEAMERFKEEEALGAVRRRMYEIAVEAALQGKLKLSKNAARDYPTSNSNPVSVAK